MFLGYLAQRYEDTVGALADLQGSGHSKVHKSSYPCVFIRQEDANPLPFRAIDLQPACMITQGSEAVMDMRRIFWLSAFVINITFDQPVHQVDASLITQVEQILSDHIAITCTRINEEDHCIQWFFTLSVDTAKGLLLYIESDLEEKLLDVVPLWLRLLPPREGSYLFRSAARLNLIKQHRGVASKEYTDRVREAYLVQWVFEKFAHKHQFVKYAWNMYFKQNFIRELLGRYFTSTGNSLDTFNEPAFHQYLDTVIVPELLAIQAALPEYDETFVSARSMLYEINGIHAIPKSARFMAALTQGSPDEGAVCRPAPPVYRGPTDILTAVHELKAGCMSPIQSGTPSWPMLTSYRKIRDTITESSTQFTKTVLNIQRASPEHDEKFLWNVKTAYTWLAMPDVLLEIQNSDLMAQLPEGAALACYVTINDEDQSQLVVAIKLPVEYAAYHAIGKIAHNAYTHMEKQLHEAANTRTESISDITCQNPVYHANTTYYQHHREATVALLTDIENRYRNSWSQ